MSRAASMATITVTKTILRISTSSERRSMGADDVVMLGFLLVLLSWVAQYVRDAWKEHRGERARVKASWEWPQTHAARRRELPD
jgi:hypothetical protein